MNQSVHVRLHRFPIRQDNLGRISLHRPGLQSRKCLRHNLVRLLHLAHAHEVAGPYITVGFDGNFKVVFLITRVGVCPANVEIHSTSAQAWPGKAPVNCIFCCDYAHALRALLKNPVPRQQRMKLVNRLEKAVLELLHTAFKARR